MLLLRGGLGQTRGVLAILAIAVVILVMMGLAYLQDFTVPSFMRPYRAWKGDASNPDDLRDFFINEVRQPYVSITTEVYRPMGAYEWKLPGKPRWKKPLGKDLCILDLDSRSLDGPGSIFGNITFSWNDPEVIVGTSLGILQHWLYAKIHGYRYYWVQTEQFTDRRGSWKKPSILKRVLQKHKTCVFVDSDAIFTNMDLPFEWLLNYWDIDREKDAVALAQDPPAPRNNDERGKLYDNTGFIIAQHSQTTFDMMQEWAVCADDGGKYPNCTQYRDKTEHPSDQGGFGNYIRYEYEGSVKELPCSEANGFPQHNSKCKGTFVKHLWTGKRDLIKMAVGLQIPGQFLELFHEQMLREKDEYYITEKDLMSEAWLHED